MVLETLANKLTKALQCLNEKKEIDESILNNILKEISNALIAADVKLSLVVQMRKNVSAAVKKIEIVPGFTRKKLIEEQIINELKNMIDPGKKAWEPTKGRVNVIMFVGLQGAGKTTSCTKLANYYKNKKFKVALICADTYRAGAFEQLQQNATKVGIPFFGSKKSTDPVQIAKNGLEAFRKEKFDIIMVDTSGRHKQETSLFEEMTVLNETIKPDEIIFVMDSSIGQAAYEQAKAFNDSVGIGSVILTKLDSGAKGGGSLSAVAASGSPITFFTSGEQIGDIEPFNSESFIKRILGYGDVGQLVEKIQKAEIKDNQEELLEKLKQRKLTLRDMRDQFLNVLKLGPVGSIMKLIPGFNSLGKKHGDKSQKRIQRFLTLMDSMTDEELDGDIKLLKVKSRIDRISKGAGMDLLYIKELVELYKPFEIASNKIKSLNLKNGKIPKNSSSLTGMFPPHVLNNIGGKY